MTISHKKQFLHHNLHVQYRPSMTLYAFHSNHPTFPFPSSSLPTPHGDQLTRHKNLSLSQTYRPTNQSIAHSPHQAHNSSHSITSQKYNLSNSLRHSPYNSHNEYPCQTHKTPSASLPFHNHKSQIPQRSNRPQHSSVHPLYNHLHTSPRAQIFRSTTATA